jgi:hypothetical protein
MCRSKHVPAATPVSGKRHLAFARWSTERSSSVEIIWIVLVVLVVLALLGFISR